VDKDMHEIFSKLLKERGETAYKVSKATGISQSTLSGWKRGISQPKADKLQKIANNKSLQLWDFPMVMGFFLCLIKKLLS
jgi:transcriptional regulator with XRE-family HTH domain